MTEKVYQYQQGYVPDNGNAFYFWVDCSKEVYEEELAEGGSARVLYTAAPPAVLPTKYADELKERADLIEAYSKTQCEIAQELGCDSDNESILKAICEIKELGPQQQQMVVELLTAFHPDGDIEAPLVVELDDVTAILDAAGVKWEVKS